MLFGFISRVPTTRKRRNGKYATGKIMRFFNKAQLIARKMLNLPRETELSINDTIKSYE
jgi:hypothetical protein